jgi:hypothetical protein
VIKRSFSTLAVAVVVLAPASSVALAAGGWQVVATKTASGQFAATATNATVNHPSAIAVRLTGGSGLVVWACDSGDSVSSWSRNVSSGWHQLPHAAGRGSCDITASVGGTGRVSVQILSSR